MVDFGGAGMKDVSRILLPIYFFIALAASPLSSVHIEDELVSARFVYSNKHSTKTLHQFFHELFFAHFDNKLNHITDTSPDTTFTLGAKKDRRNSCFRLSHSKDILASPIFSPSVRITAEKFVRHSNYASSFIDYRPLCSGLSPPSV